MMLISNRILSGIFYTIRIRIRIRTLNMKTNTISVSDPFSSLACRGVEDEGDGIVNRRNGTEPWRWRVKQRMTPGPPHHTVVRHHGTSSPRWDFITVVLQWPRDAW
jgi:hypothetical protein